MLLNRNLFIMNQGGYFGLILLIIGIISNPCDARAVNISNTWTLPHDGFTVFYRFFRDQISWFEADAVCQFHHANLVTVTNSVEFDASREFLRILDVTEPVWIGLMRSQSSDRFYWSNSKPLVSTAEYWAESLPVIDAPLCAVIDPVRDYRWHALRCGGPETASFLCEMNVPSWAEECVIRDIPSLTIQYMADSGTVEITKDCGDEEGTIIQVCRGKQDLDKIINNLICKNEKIQQEIQQIFSHERQNLIINSDLLDSHKKSIEIIKNAQTDNNEDNNISVQNNNGFHPAEKISEQETENPVQKLIEQFDVEELMQADQPQEQQKQEILQTSSPSDEIMTSTSVTATQKTLKRRNKKVRSGDKKSNKKLPNGQKKEQRGKNIALEDMMLGDQPILGFGDDDLNEIQEPLPHTKKMLPQDLKHEDDHLARDKDLNKVVKEKIPDKVMLTTTTTQSTVVAATTHSATPEKEMESITFDNTDDEAVIATTTLPIIATDDIADDASRTNGPISTTVPLAAEENLNTASGVPSDGAISSLPNEASISITTSESESLPSSTLTVYTNLPDSTTTTATISSSHVSVTTFSPGEFKSTPAVTIGHPMHPQQPRSNVISEETAHQHIKETNDNHFIPPMLMVKSHYQSPKSALGHNNEHQLDLQIVRKKTTPTESNSTTLISAKDEVNYHLDSELNTITTTTKSLAPALNNLNDHSTTLTSSKLLPSNFDHDKTSTVGEATLDQSSTTQSADEKPALTTIPESDVLEQNQNTASTSTTLTSKDAPESKLVTDKDVLESQQITPTATITPNQVVEIKLSNDGSTENPRTFSITTKPVTLEASEIEMHSQNTPFIDETQKSSPTIDKSTSSSITADDSAKVKDDEIHFIPDSENLPNAESLKLSSFSESTVLKTNLPTTVGETLIGTSTQENVNDLLTTITAESSISDKKTYTSEINNNFTTINSASESDDNNRSKQSSDNEDHSITSTRATTAIKTLPPTKKISMLKKHNLKKTSSSDTTATVSSSSSIEEGSVGHHDVYTSDEGSFEQHKPNRKRILTKPETQSYLKKILG